MYRKALYLAQSRYRPFQSLMGNTTQILLDPLLRFDLHPDFRVPWGLSSETFSTTRERNRNPKFVVPVEILLFCATNR